MRLYNGIMGRKPIHIDDSILSEWFRDLPSEIFLNYPIHANNFASKISSRLGRMIRISKRSIIRILSSFFDVFRSRRWVSTTEPQLRMQEYLSNRLHDVFIQRNEGLKHPRQEFVVLCFFAKEYHSRPLADTLYRFLAENLDKITAYEETAFLPEWEIGVQQLDGMIRQDAYSSLIFQLTPSRGRHHLRLDMAPMYRSRAFTAPPPRIRSRSPPGSILPPMPERFSLDPGVEDFIDRQDRLEMRVAELENEVDGVMPIIADFFPSLGPVGLLDW